MNTTDNPPITTGTKLGSMILDHFIMTMIAMIFFIPGMISIFANAFNVTHEQQSFNIMDGTFGYLSMLGLAIYFCKDAINGRSIAKRILKLQVVDNRTGEAANPVKCLIRNLFCAIWPIEVLVTLSNTNRRLGDRVAGTKVVTYDPSQEKQKVSVGQVFTSLVMAYGCVLLLMIPFKSIESRIEAHSAKYIESSFNQQLSTETEKLFADNLGQYLTASVRVYDKIQDKPLKYVSIIFQLKQNYLANDDSYQQIRSTTLQLLYSKFPEGTIMGQVKYVYKSSGIMQMRSMQL